MKALQRLERSSSRRYKVIIRRLRKQGFTTEGLINSLKFVKHAVKTGDFDRIAADQRTRGFPRTLHDKHMPDLRKLVIA